MSIEKVIQTIKDKDNFLITTHINPECDALGSELAFSGLLKRLGKSCFIVNEETPPREYKFLPGINSIKTIKHLNQIKDFNIAVVLDCSDLNRTGKVSKLITQDKFIINIDHHISNTRFGDVNWVQTKSSCVCEMVYRLYKRLKVPFDRNAALICMWVYLPIRVLFIIPIRLLLPIRSLENYCEKKFW